MRARNDSGYAEFTRRELRGTWARSGVSGSIPECVCVQSIDSFSSVDLNSPHLCCSKCVQRPPRQCLLFTLHRRRSESSL